MVSILRTWSHLNVHYLTSFGDGLQAFVRDYWQGMWRMNPLKGKIWYDVHKNKSDKQQALRITSWPNRINQTAWH